MSSKRAVLKAGDRAVFLYDGDESQPVSCKVRRVLSRAEVGEPDRRNTGAEIFYELGAVDGSTVVILPAGSVRPDALYELWLEHQAAPFPPGALGRMVAGRDLTTLSVGVGGYVGTFVDLGELDGRCRTDLVRRVMDLAMVLGLLEGEERRYFGRLMCLAVLVLAAGPRGPEGVDVARLVEGLRKELGDR